MAHRVLKDSYVQLTERLNRFPQGAPPEKLLFEILSMLFSKREAELVAMLPIKPFTAQKAAKIWKLDITSARKILDELASRAILVDIPDEKQNNENQYVLPPPMAGFFEFSLMRVRSDIDQKLLSELFYQYLTVEEDFIRELFTNGETQLGRTFVHEPVLSTENSLYVLDYERASEVIKTAKYMAVGICYCRHKMQHLGKACNAPLDICMTFNSVACSLSKYEYARAVDKAEGLDLLQKAYHNNLVQFGENVRKGVSFICNCCGCCCEAMIAQRRFALLNPIHTTNFLPEIDNEKCTGCGKCVDICPVEAMTLISANDPHKTKRKIAKLDADFCLGCGLCVRACKSDALKLQQREKRVITPLNGAHKAVVMALERGKLQNLIFDIHALQSHRALAAIFGAILKLPPIKRTLAKEQIKSQYLENLIMKYEKSED